MIIDPMRRSGLRSFAITAENPTGAKGEGGKSASVLGVGRKGSPCLKDIAPGATVTLADIKGSGCINHIWMTVTDKTSEADCFVLRDLVLLYQDAFLLKGGSNP